MKKQQFPTEMNILLCRFSRISVDRWVWHPCAQESVDVDAGDRILLYTGARDGTPDGPGSVGQLIWTIQRDWTGQ